MNLPQDILNDIMKHIDDLPTLICYCNVNKETLVLYSSQYYWYFKLDKYYLPRPTTILTLSQWFKLYDFILRIDKWLIQKKTSISLYFNNISEDKIMPLIMKYDGYIRPNYNNDREYKLSHIYITHNTEYYFVTICYSHMQYTGGIFNKKDLFQFLYQLELLN